MALQYVPPEEAVSTFRKASMFWTFSNPVHFSFFDDCFPQTGVGPPVSTQLAATLARGRVNLLRSLAMRVHFSLFDDCFPQTGVGPPTPANQFEIDLYLNVHGILATSVRILGF